MKRPITKRQIKRKLSFKKPTIWIGKNGVSQQMLAEIDRQLEKTEMVKVRILKTALTSNKAKAVASTISQSTKSTIVEVRGHTIILYREKNKD